jgi:hypothetical protein
MTNTELIAKYGEPGTQLTQMIFPYQMYYDGKVVRSTQVHKVNAGTLKLALEKILTVYGPDRIKSLGLDQYGGCFNNRTMRGSEDKLSLHAFGAAIDLYPSKNTLKMKSDVALFVKPEYKEFIDIMEDHGWYSLGRAKNYDWMHFQTEKP